MGAGPVRRWGWLGISTWLLSSGCGGRTVGVSGEDSSSESSGSSTDPSSTDGSSTNGSSTDTGDDPPHDCGHVSIRPEYVPPEILVVSDISRSMAAQTWDHDGDPGTPPVSRWASAHQVLTRIGEIFAEPALLGLQLFPALDACAGSDDCLVAAACELAPAPEAPVSEQTLAQWLSLLPAADTDTQVMGGGSPAHAALSAAYDQLRARPLEHVKAVMLITDGFSNCTADWTFPETLAHGDPLLADLVMQAHEDDHITTIVIGIDPDGGVDQAGIDAIAGYDAAAALDQLAFAGGTPNNPWDADLRHYWAFEDVEMLLGLLSIDEGLSECVLDLSQSSEGVPEPEQWDLVWVESTVEGQEPVVEPELDAAACMSADGWSWLVEGEVITMCGATCDAFNDGTAYFDIYYGCPPP